MIPTIWEFNTLQVGVTVDVELSLQLAVAVFVAVLYSGIDDGPSVERPVNVEPGVGVGTGIVPELLSPSPLPPHVKRTIASNANSNDRKLLWEYGEPFALLR